MLRISAKQAISLPNSNSAASVASYLLPDEVSPSVTSSLPVSLYKIALLRQDLPSSHSIVSSDEFEQVPPLSVQVWQPAFLQENRFLKRDLYIVVSVSYRLHSILQEAVPGSPTGNSSETVFSICSSKSASSCANASIS